MITYTGYLRKMDHLGISPVNYKWSFVNYPGESNGKKPEKSESIHLESKETVNEWIGKKITFSTNGKIRCVDCGRPTSKSFGGGSCYVCFTTKANNDFCILKPENCHFHKGTCREPDWGKLNCFKKHTLYFASSSGLKVGITKENPVSNRWVDQGARFGIPVLEVESRLSAGILERYLAGFLPDKTSWQKLIQGDPPDCDLIKEKTKFLKHLLSKEFQINETENKMVPLIWKAIENSDVTELTYPILSYPKKIKSFKLSESEAISGILTGIKGQYLLFENGAINIRSYGGYQFIINVE